MECETKWPSVYVGEKQFGQHSVALESKAKGNAGNVRFAVQREL